MQLSNYTNITNALFNRQWLLDKGSHKALCMSISKIEDMDSEELCIDVTPMLTVMGDIAYIRIQGIITAGLGLSPEDCECLGIVDSQQVIGALRLAEKDNAVKGIMLVINSAGGMVNGTPEVGEAVYNCSKPVVAYCDVLTASAAYWIASQADLIVAQPSTEIGSIGVYTTVMDSSEYFSSLGFKNNLIKAGKYKAIGVDGVAVSKEQLDYMQGEIDSTMEWFKEAVTRRRTIKADAMQGQCFYAKDGIYRGLVDVLGSGETAVEELTALIEQNSNTNSGF